MNAYRAAIEDFISNWLPVDLSDSTVQLICIDGRTQNLFNTQQARNRDFKAPDFFVVLSAENNPERQERVLWEEGGRYLEAMRKYTQIT